MSVKIIIIDMKIDLLNSFTHIIKYTPILYLGRQSYRAPLGPLIDDVIESIMYSGVL